MSTLRIRAAALDVTISAEGPDAGSAEVSAVLAQLGNLLSATLPEPDAYLVTDRPTRRERRRAAAVARTRSTA